MGKNARIYINFGLDFDRGIVCFSYEHFIYNIKLSQHTLSNIDTIFNIDLFDNVSVFNRSRFIMNQTKFSYLQ